jgi:hypothetical protein
MLGATLECGRCSPLDTPMLMMQAVETYRSQFRPSGALRRGHSIQVPPPVDDIETLLTPFDRAQLPILSAAIVARPERVREGLESMISRTSADEIIVATQICDHAVRAYSYEIVAKVRGISD